MEPFDVQFGRHQRGLRLAQGLTQPELAAQLGMNMNSVSKWERGEAFPEASSMVALSRVLPLDLERAFAAGGPASSQRRAALIELEKVLKGQPDTVLRLVLELARVTAREMKRSR